MRIRFIGDAALCRQWYGYALNRYRALGNSQSCILRPDIGVEIVLRKENDLVGEIRIKAQAKTDYYSTQYVFIDITIGDVSTCDLLVMFVDNKTKDGNIYLLRLPLITPSYRIADKIITATFDLADPKNVYFLTSNTTTFSDELHDVETHTYTLYKTVIEKDEEGNPYLTNPQFVNKFVLTSRNIVREKVDISYPMWDSETETTYTVPWDVYYTVEGNFHTVNIRGLYINGNVFKWLYTWDRIEIHEHIDDEDPTHTGYHHIIVDVYNPDSHPNSNFYWYSLLVRGTEKREQGYEYGDIGNFSCSHVAWSIFGETIKMWDPSGTSWNIETEWYFFKLVNRSLPAIMVSPLCILNEDDFLVAEANSYEYTVTRDGYHYDYIPQIDEWYTYIFGSPVLFYINDFQAGLPNPPFRLRIYTNDDQYQQIVGHPPPILYEIDSGYNWTEVSKMDNQALHLYVHDYSVAIGNIVKSSEADLNFFHNPFVGYLQNKKAYLAAKKEAEETNDETKRKDAILRGVLIGNKSIFFINATKQTTWAKDIQEDILYDLYHDNTHRVHMTDIILVDKRNNICRCNGKPLSIGGNNNGT